MIPFCVLFAGVKPAPQVATLLVFGFYASAHRFGWVIVRTGLTYVILLSLVFAAWASSTYWVLLWTDPVCDAAGRCVMPLPHAIFSLVSGVVAAGIFGVLVWRGRSRWPGMGGHFPYMIHCAGIACLLVALLYPLLS